MSGHTPGPWRVRRWEHAVEDDLTVTRRELTVYYPAGGENGYREVVVFPLGGDPEVNAETEANARLVSAAPDLLVAVRHLCEAIVDDDEELIADAYVLAGEALQRAEGRE